MTWRRAPFYVLAAPLVVAALLIGQVFDAMDDLAEVFFRWKDSRR